MLASQAYAQSDADARAKQDAQGLVKFYGDWAKMSDLGASLEAKEVARQGSMVQYHFYVKGLNTESLYTAFTWPVTAAKPVAAISGISIGKDGVLICAGRTSEQCGDPAKKDDPIEFTFYPAKGEPYP